MNEILMITNADMSVQAGNVVLVGRRAEELFKQYNMSTVCMVVRHPNLFISHNVEGIEYRIVDKREQIKDFIINARPRIIIFYGELAYLYIPYVKKLIKKIGIDAMLWLDVQGVLEEMIEYSRGIKLFSNYIKYAVKKMLLFRAINMVGGAFVVSEELKDYCMSMLNKKRREQFRIIKIRCGINDLLSTPMKLVWRKEIRDSWGIDEDTTVMVFSGYRMSWQNIDQIIRMFKTFDENQPKVFFAFYCNLDDAFENFIAKTFAKGNYCLKFLAFNEYFKYLSACDVGYLIRDYNITNRVAFPNKFSDYLNAGLMVATNKALREPIRVLEYNQLVYIDVEADDEKTMLAKAAYRRIDLQQYYAQTEDICRNELLYSTQIAGSDLMSISEG